MDALSGHAVVLSESAFRRHLELIRHCDYQVVSMDQALRFLQAGRATAGRYVCITFDDGRVDNATIAWPLLKAFGFTAHFFVCPALLGVTVRHASGADDFMRASALRAILREGGSVGSHTQTHPDLSSLAWADLEMQIAGSRSALEELTGARINTIAYPYARYNAEVLQATRQAGYEYGFTITTGTVRHVGESGSTKNLTIPRNVMRSGLDPAENYAILRGGFDFTRPFSLIRNQITAWLS